MNLLTFLGYFIVSMTVYQALVFVGFYGFKFFTQKRLESKIKSGKVKMISMEDIVSELSKTQKQENGDGSWH
jgi:hypothetical protein